MASDFLRVPHHQLAFGEGEAVECNSLLQFSENTRQIVPTLIGYDAERPQEFRSRASFSLINGLPLFSASLPNARTHARVGGGETHTFGFHLAGDCAFEVERSIYSIRPNASAVFLPVDCSWIVEVSNPSTVVASVEKGRLESTARIMLGDGFNESLVSRFRNPAELALQFGSLSFDSIFRLLFSQIDGYRGNQALLDASGLDDTFYRTLVIAMAPETFARQSGKPAERISSRQLERVRQYVMANLGGHITLTDLEQVAHMSRRTLHNAFMKAHGLSPMAWVREQRLLAALQQLRGSASVGSVTEVLYSCGFTNASQFAALYARRFGELPSETLARSRQGF